MSHADWKSEKPRRSRERKRSKRLKRQQPERKEKYRERQYRANRKQHHKLSKPSTRHDMQRQRSERSFLGLTPMHNTASAVISRWDLYGLMGETLPLEAQTSATTVGNVLRVVEPPSEARLTLGRRPWAESAVAAAWRAGLA